MSDFEKRVSDLDKHLNKLSKQNEEQAKLENDRNRQIEKATRGQSKAFTGLINDLQKVRPETAKIVSEFKSAGDDTLKGALLNRKTTLAIEAANIATTEGMDALNEEQARALKSLFGDTQEKLNEVLPQIAELANDIAATEEHIAKSKDSIYAYEQDILQTEADIADLTERKKEHKVKVAEQEKMQAELEALMSQEVHEKNKKTHAMQIGALQDKIENVLTQNALEEQTISDMSANRESLLAKQKDQLAVENSIVNNQTIDLQEMADKKETLLAKEIDIRDEMSSNMEKAKDEQLAGLTSFSDGLKGLTGFDLIGAFDDGVKMFNNVKKVGEGIFTASKSMINGLKGMPAALKGLKVSVGGFIKGGVSAIRGAFTTIGTSLAAAGTALMTTLTAFAAGAAAFIGGLAATAGGMLLAAAPYILAGLAIVGLVMAGMKLYEESEGFKAAVDTVIGYFIDIKDSIFKIFGGFYDFFKGLFTGDFDLMFSGIKDVFGGLWDLIKAPFKAIGDFFKNVFGIDIMAKLKQMAKAILPGVVYRALFDDDVPEMNEQAKEKGLGAAEESGLYEKKGIGRASVVNPDMIVTAPNNQLNAILADNDINDETKELIQKELEARKSIITSYNEAKTALDSGQSTLADGSDASLVMELAEGEMTKRRTGSQIEQATLDAQPNTGTPTGAGGETVVQQNNNNSSTNIMNSTDTARDENDRYYAALGVA